jgi:hypothetical protein
VAAVPGPLMDVDEMVIADDRAIGLMAPVADAVVSGVGDLPPGATIPDIACGGGEPGLTCCSTRVG